MKTISVEPGKDTDKMATNFISRMGSVAFILLFTFFCRKLFTAITGI